MGNQMNTTFKHCCNNDYSQNKKEVDIGDPQHKIKSMSSMNGDASKYFENKLYKKTNKANNDNEINMPFKKQENSIVDITHNYNVVKEVDRIKQLEQTARKAPKLILKVINSITLSKGTTLIINAQGLEGSIRGKKDGITYFGCKKKSKPLNENFETAEILNDFIIRNKDPEANDRHRGRHFQIEYSIESNSYCIKDLGIGFGAFVKIDQPLLLKDNNLLSMGSSFLIINFSEDFRESLIYSHTQEATENNNSNPAGTPLNGDGFGGTHSQKRNQMNSPLPNSQSSKGENGLEGNLGSHIISGNNRRSVLSQNASDITIKIFGGPNYGDVYQFSTSIPIIKIGRMPDCEIRIEDNLLSKYQASIKYISGTGWTLLDGYNGKPSTNSNWLYLNDDFEMYNNMVFKANHTLFEVNNLAILMIIMTLIFIFTLQGYNRTT